MFHQHPSFKPPTNKDQKCWRYMDFTRFVDMIDSSQLYFTRTDKLDDYFEGTFTKMTYAKKNEAGLSYPEFYQKQRASTLVNCWHMNNYESAAMWKLYLKSDEGIAIQTTYNRMINSLLVETRFFNFVGIINYLDYETEEFDYSNTFNAFLCKRKSFEHEKEIRILIDLGIVNPGCEPSKLKVDHGLKINIQLEELIENIYISPTAPKWIINLLESLLRKYQFKIPIKQSELIGDALI